MLIAHPKTRKFAGEDAILESWSRLGRWATIGNSNFKIVTHDAPPKEKRTALIHDMNYIYACMHVCKPRRQ